MAKRRKSEISSFRFLPLHGGELFHCAASLGGGAIALIRLVHEQVNVAERAPLAGYLFLSQWPEGSLIYTSGWDS